MPRNRYAETDTALRCRVCGKWLMSINGGHLKTHGLTVADYKERFNVAYIFCDYLRRRVSERRRSEGGRKPRVKGPFVPRTKEDIVREIRAYGLLRRPLTSEWLSKKDAGLVKQSLYAFQRWDRVLRAAGAEQKKFIRWNPPKVIRTIQRLHACGASLQDRRISKGRPALYSAAHTWLGSWKAAVEAAGFVYGKIRVGKPRTRSSVARDLAAWSRKHGRLYGPKLNETDPALLAAAYKVFGPLEKAAKALRLPFRLGIRRWSRRVVKEGIRAMARKNLSLQAARVMERDRNLYGAGLRYFGSWGEALRKSGFDPADHAVFKRRPVEGVAQDLREWSKTHGPLNTTLLRETDPALMSAVTEKFGTVETAAIRVGLPSFRRHRKWSPEEVVREIRERQRKGASVKATAVIIEFKNLYSAAQRYFGTWGRAVRLASDRKDFGDGPATHPPPANVLDSLNPWLPFHGLPEASFSGNGDLASTGIGKKL